MSLAFLFKKTWHPSKLQNAEMVWKAEQKDAAEKRQIEELTKRVREEQQVRELEEMQAAGGHGPGRKERIDWMYEGPMQSAQDQQAEANEYLMGKEFKLADKETSELKKLEENKAPGTLFTANPTTSANEAFRRVQEDPLLRMRKARMEAEESVMKNPVKMSKIRQQLEAELAAKAEKKRARKEAKKAKKEAKKEKKREKKERELTRQEDSVSSSDDDRRRDNARETRRDDGVENRGVRLATVSRREGGGHRDRSGRRRLEEDATRTGARKTDRGWREDDNNRREARNRRLGSNGGMADWSEGHRHRGSRNENESGYRRSSDDDLRSGGGPRAARRDRDEERFPAPRGERGGDRRGKSASRSRSPKRRDCDSRGEREKERESHRHRSDRKRTRSRSGSPPTIEATARKSAPAAGVKRYGLVGGRGGGGGGASLGPAAKLVEAKERERSEREKARLEERRRRVMTPEEKMRRLKEMEDDGMRNQELKKRRVEDGKRTDARDGGSAASGAGARGRAREGSETEEPSASFLDKMRSEQVDGMGLEERMQRNRHYHQRGADAHNFMDRG